MALCIQRSISVPQSISTSTRKHYTTTTHAQQTRYACPDSQTTCPTHRPHCNLAKPQSDNCVPFRHQLMTTIGYIDHPVPDSFWGSVSSNHRHQQNTFGLLLAQPYQRHGKTSVCFHCKSGAKLDRLLAYVKKCQLLDHYQPSVILLQMGGNDISMQFFELSRLEVTIDAFTSYCQSIG
ncbi:unnamed protein product [Mytilus edulis]|uniref:Uncharacterized protein n=1 Tax=Mytilus edulis TaxID=6550 RepID=A0A8S3SHB5_MYTED|nr:unnamed protein product [Mytilus edulis]